MATATAPVSRATLEDRWIGVMFDGPSSEVDDPREWDYSERHAQLNNMLFDIVGDVARCHHDDAGEIVGDLKVIIREHILSRIEADGLAR